MNKLPVINIYNEGKKIYLFCRDKDGKPFIRTDELFKPYYYEQSDEGIYKGYNNTRLKKIVCSKPSDLSKNRTTYSFESDIIYTKRYLIDNIEIEKAPIRWILFDLEVLTDIFPDPSKADKPISCIGAYDNFDNKGISFWLPNYKSEYEMIERFAKYIKERQPDLLIAYNGDNFDFPYLFNRFPDFAKRISPIEQEEYHTKHPAGISCVDYYKLDKKFTLNRRKQYTLEAVSQEELNFTENLKVDFNTLDENIKLKNKQDILNMVGIENKKHYLDLCNDIRILSKCVWRDLEFNSKIVDQLLLQEAKIVGIILPKKIYSDERTEGDDVEFEGAYRECFKKGLFKNIGKYDLSGAYLYTIADLCLDEQNILNKVTSETLPVRITDRKTNEIIKILNIKQNDNSILPRLAKKLIQDKIKYKELKDNTAPDSSKYKDVENKYNAIKTIFLSAWGCIGNKGFRLHNADVAGMITSTPRDLIHYIIKELKIINLEVIYCDTDSVFILDEGKDISKLLNDLIQKWSKERFNKPSSIRFEYEGHFEKLFLIALCHYTGLLKTEKGIKTEEKGIEAKKKDSTPFMAKTQRTAIDMILQEKSEKDIVNYKKQRIEEIKNTSLLDIALPAKISPNKEYKNEPIHIRALRYAQEENTLLEIKPGDLFYWIYVKPFGEEKKLSNRKKKVTKKELKEGIKQEWTKNKKGEYYKIAVVETSKEKDIIAFIDKLDKKFKVDWDRMIERNISKKIDTLINALNNKEDE